VIPSGAGGTINIQGLASPAKSVLIDGVGSGIFTGAVGTGPGGNTNISAQSVTIQNGGTISASTSGIEASATGGNITVSSIQSTTLNNGGSITAGSTGPANAGNITINAGSQFLSQNSAVTTEASQASGGDITIQATDSIRLVNSTISTSVQGGPETSGGNITIDPTFMTLQNSQILAQAVQGQGGNINIVAGTFLADQTSLVSASSQFGLSGAVNIQSPISMLSGSLATLPKRPLQVQQLLQQRCAAQANGQLSSLVVAGRDTLPSEPGGWLMSSMALLAEDVPVSPPHPLPSDALVPSHQTMIVSGQLSERRTPSPQQGVTNWAAGCGS
jgi:large exoprotein involved in heme utilization and adhesion